MLSNSELTFKFYDYQYFSTLPCEKLLQLSKILQISENLLQRPSIFGFQKAYYCYQFKVWVFHHVDDIYVISGNDFQRINNHIFELHKDLIKKVREAKELI